jgi:thiol-disulfide isomerase/thioredoxin
MSGSTPHPITALVQFAAIISSCALWVSCASAPPEADRQRVVELERVADTGCDQPGGWTNLFFTGDADTAEGSVAVFAETASGLMIEVVRRDDGSGEMQYSFRVSPVRAEQVLEFAPTELGRCATAELHVEGVAHPLRMQVATAEEWVYGRIAEYRAGYMATDGFNARIEIHPRSRAAIGLNTLENVEIFVSRDGTDEIRTASQRLETGEVLFSDEAGEAFLLGKTAFAIDSLSTDSRRLYLSEIDDAALPYRGFEAPEFAGTDLDGNPHHLSDHLGEVVVIEFWSTECVFSEIARPQANHLAAELEATSGTLIAMARESDVEMLNVHLESHPRASIVLLRDEETWQRWNPETATPLYYVIDSDGRVLLRERGARAVRLAAAVAGIPMP